jgi:CPA1 family monovalent cation:H+ antiporter
MSFESQFIGLMAIAVLVAVSARRLRVPHTIAMMLTGLGAGMLRLGPELTDISLDPHLILVTFLPGLLFEAAYHLDLRELRDNLRTILMLAVPGVLLSMFVIGVLLNQILGIRLVEALLFGILISATDPIAVTALFRELGVSKRLSIIVEGESLFNDGAAIVLYSILLGVATGDQAFSLAGSITNFFATVAGGAVLGLVAGLIVGEMMRRTEDHLIDIALTTILAYGTYLVAEELLHGAVSPVIAVVVAAIYVGNYGSNGGYSATSTVTIVSFWEFVAFLINSAIFLLIGLDVAPADLLKNIKPVMIGVGVILLARALVVYPLGFLVNWRVRKMPIEWAHVLFWGGLRGAVSVALILSLPAPLEVSQPLESRLILEEMAYGYILFSLIVQGLTIRPLLGRLGLTHVGAQEREYERRQARMVMAHAAMHAIDNLHEQNILSGPVCDNLRATFKQQFNEHWSALEKIVAAEPRVIDTNFRYMQREIAGAQKQSLLQMMRRGTLSEDVYSELVREVDEQIQRSYQEGWRPPFAFVISPQAPPLDEQNEPPE